MGHNKKERNRAILVVLIRTLDRPMFIAFDRHLGRKLSRHLKQERSRHLGRKDAKQKPKKFS